MKRILMTADTLRGVWTYSLELVRALQPYGVEVSLATMGHPLSANQQRSSRTLDNLKVFESNFRMEWMEDAWTDVADAIPWNAPTLIAGHSCVFSWWKAVHGTTPPDSWNRYRDEVTTGLKSVTHVVSPSRAMLNNLIEHYGPLTSASVVPDGRNRELFRAGRKAPLILCAGRLWDEAKNVSALMDVAQDLAWPVYLAGEDQFGTSRQPITGKVQYLGHLRSEDLAVWMARASVFVSPSRYEPFGLTILEAALSGCALILGDIASLRENWHDAALFVSPDDRGQLKRTIQRLTQDPHELQRWTARAQERAQAFTPERMADRYMELYRTL